MEPMQITGYTDGKFQTPTGSVYSLMLNPDSLKWNRSIEYNAKRTPGASSPSQKYLCTPSDKLSFEAVIDCTGVVDNTRTDMETEINGLKNIVFTFNGTIHRPNFVQLQWGKTLIFNGVLDSFDTSYTLFKPDGDPLRARISLAFSSYLAPDVVPLKDNKESPDVTHVVDVVEGISLPQMCDNVWNNEMKYVQVAKYNDLNKFRNLHGVDRIFFPPIIPQN